MEETVRQLMNLGLTKYEAKAYITLLMKGITTAYDLAKASGIPQPRIYDVMESLAEKGLIEIQDGRPRKYRPIEPKTALNQLTRRLMESWQSLTGSLQKIYEDRRLSWGKPSIWLIKGRRSIKDRIKAAINEAKYEIHIALPEEIINEFVKPIISAYERGVFISIVIYPKKFNINYENLTKYSLVRIRGTASLSITLVDNRLGILCSYKTLTEDGQDGYGVIIEENKDLLRVLIDYYHYTLWQLSEPMRPDAYQIRLPATYVCIWTAINLIERLKKMGYNVLARVEGKEVRTGNQIEVEGYVEKTIMDGKEKIYSILIRKDDGSLISVGGLGASIEDVEAIRIIINVEKIP